MYIACRISGYPRSLKEISAQTEIPHKDIGKSLTFVKKLLNLNEEMGVINSGGYMTRFISNLDVPTMYEIAASHIAQKAKELDAVEGKSPISVAAAAIFMVLSLAKPEHRCASALQARCLIDALLSVNVVTGGRGLLLLV